MKVAHRVGEGDSVVFEWERLVRAHDDDEVVGGRLVARQFVLGKAIGFAKQSLDAIAHRSGANAATDGNADAMRRATVGPGMHSDDRTVGAGPTIHDFLEDATTAQSLLTPESQARRGHESRSIRRCQVRMIRDRVMTPMMRPVAFLTGSGPRSTSSSA